MPGMSQAITAQPPVLLHPPHFIPPGMSSSALSGWQSTQRGRASSGSTSQPGVTVSGSDCDKLITLFVFIGKTSAASTSAVDRKAQAKRARDLLERAKHLLSKMGPWNCCKGDRHYCMVKLAMEIVTIRSSGGSHPAPIVAHFYNNEAERMALMGTPVGTTSGGDRRDTFGLWQPSAGTPDLSGNDVGAILMPSIGQYAGEVLPSYAGGLNGLDPAAVPGTNYPAALGNDDPVGSQPDPQGRPDHIIELRYAYDVLSIILHEILHAMGAEHDKRNAVANIMQEARQTGKPGAFAVTTFTACEIAAKNGVCVGTEFDRCCKSSAVPAYKQVGPWLPSGSGGFIVPGMSIAGAMGMPARGGTEESHHERMDA